MDDELKANWLDPMYELDEKEAWTVLAHLWDTPNVGERSYVFITFNDTNCQGLCTSVDELLFGNKIYKQTFMTMKHKLRVALNTEFLGQTYFYPLSLNGAVQRAAFCRRMADEC